MMTVFVKTAIDTSYFNARKYVSYIVWLYTKTVDFSLEISDSADLAIDTLHKAIEQYGHYIKNRPSGINDSNEQLWNGMKYDLEKELPVLEGKQNTLRARQYNVSVYDIARFDKLKTEKKELETELWQVQFGKQSMFSKMFAKKDNVEIIQEKLKRVTEELDYLAKKMK